MICKKCWEGSPKAQLFKSYRTDSLADSLMTEAHKVYLSEFEAVTFGNTNKVLNNLENAPITWAGKSLNLESKVCLKFIFSLGSYTSDLSDLSLRVSYTDTYGNSKAGTIDNKDDVLTCSFFSV